MQYDAEIMIFGYRPHPFHTAVSALYILAGYAVLRWYDWMAFGLIMITLGIVTALAINIRLIVDGYAEYWSNLRDFIKLIERSKNSDALYEAFGLNAPASEIKITEVDKSRGEAFPIFRMHSFPVDAVTMRKVANAIVRGTPFSEREMAGRGKMMTVPAFRKLHKYLKSKEYIKPNNAKTNKLGFSLTQKGARIMYELADQEVKNHQ